jgi:hypothetical protein
LIHPDISSSEDPALREVLRFCYEIHPRPARLEGMRAWKVRMKEDSAIQSESLSQQYPEIL